MPTTHKFKVKIVKSITEIPRQDWDQVFPRIIESYNFFKTFDESDFSQFIFYYILVYDKNKPVGAANCFLMNYPLDIVVSGPFKMLTNLINKFAPGVLNPKMLICGLPMSQGAIGIVGEPQDVINAICEAMNSIAAKEKAGIIAFKDFSSSYTGMLDTCLGKSFLRIPSLPTTIMETPFVSFEEYLSSLSSVSRSGLKRKLKKQNGSPKIDLEITHELKEDALAEVHGLYLQTCSRQELDFERIPPDFFRNISKNMPQETRFFLWRMQGKMVAFAFCLVSGGVFVDYYLGFDYALAYKYNLFFVRFADLMKWCIENKVRTYEMGSTGYEPKRRMGFNLIPLYIYVKHRNKFFNPIFKFVCCLVQPKNFHPIFKELANSS